MHKEEEFVDDPEWTIWRRVKLTASQFRDWFCAPDTLLAWAILNVVVWTIVLMKGY